MSLQEILDSSLASAGPAVKATFDRDERRMSAEELRQFWAETRMFAVATAGANGAPHIAPVHVAMLEDGGLEMAIFEDSVRLKDLRRDPRIAITSWAPDGRIAIVYGRASEVPESRREVGRDAGRFVQTMRIEVDRAYAMRPSPR
jgi:nitroimidazol reductase NimA-like FMN-containing flavoprotein (pyridoxamine 5'-phosphate oxidase superfamily)